MKIIIKTLSSSELKKIWPDESFQLRRMQQLGQKRSVYHPIEDFQAWTWYSWYIFFSFFFHFFIFALPDCHRFGDDSLRRKSGKVSDFLLSTWRLWPKDNGILICMWLARLWLSGYRSGAAQCVFAVSWGCHRVCACVSRRTRERVCECKTGSVAAGVKVAQAVNSTHSLILPHFLSHSFIFFSFFFSLPLICFFFFSYAAAPSSFASAPDTLYQSQAAPSDALTHVHVHALGERHYNHSQVVCGT